MHKLMTFKNYDFMVYIFQYINPFLIIRSLIKISIIDLRFTILDILEY
jgi:hypothetical protein